LDDLPDRESVEVEVVVDMLEWELDRDLLLPMLLPELQSLLAS
jgi:hypothetical protein